MKCENITLNQNQRNPTKKHRNFTKLMHRTIGILKIIEQKVRAHEDREKQKPEAVAIVGKTPIRVQKGFNSQFRRRISDESKVLASVLSVEGARKSVGERRKKMRIVINK